MPLKSQTGELVPELPGFDMEDALKRLRGKWKLLKNVILSFADDADGQVDSLKEFIAEHQFEEAERLAHRLKGTSANIGAVRLNVISDAIEARFKLGEQTIPEAELQELEAAIQELIQNAAKIKAIENESNAEVVSNVEVNKTEVDRLLGNIAESIDIDLGKMKDNIDELGQLVRGSEFEPLAAKIEGFYAKFQLNEIKSLILEVRNQ